MFKKVLCITFCSFLLSESNAQQLQFTYDSSGNQIQRELVTIQVNVLSRENPTNSIDEIEESSEGKISLENAQIDIYPNPVVDYLNVQWTNDLNVSDVMLYDNTGKLLQLKKNNSENSSIIFDLSTYSQGFYYIKVLDLNQMSKTFKIIKR